MLSDFRVPLCLLKILLLMFVQYFRMSSPSESGARNGQDQSRGHNRDDVPPPPPTMAEVLMQIERNRMEQTRLLERLVRNTDQPSEARGLSEFQRTQPPVFGGSEEPMDAEDWLHLIENKLDTARVASSDRVPFATYQLTSDAMYWWENFRAMQAPGHVVTWEEFSAAFRKAFLNEGVMDKKKAEFRACSQGSQSVSAFLYRFNRLIRYAQCDVPTEADKQEKFRLKLTPQLRCGLATNVYCYFPGSSDGCHSPGNWASGVERAPQTYSGDFSSFRIGIAQEALVDTLLCRTSQLHTPANFSSSASTTSTELSTSSGWRPIYLIPVVAFLQVLATPVVNRATILGSAPRIAMLHLVPLQRQFYLATILRPRWGRLDHLLDMAV